MDRQGLEWYFSGMSLQSSIPVFDLFGETGAFPDVIHCERIRDRARLYDWEIFPHRHREMAQVLLMRHGTARVRLDGREQALNEGSFLFIPAQFVHGFQFSRGSEGLVLSFPLPVVNAIAAAPDRLAHRLSHPFSASDDGRIARMAQHIHDAFDGTGGFRASLLLALAQALLVVVAEIGERHHEQVEPLPRRRMLAFERLIAQNLGQNWSTRDYAAALGITPGHLNRICRAAVGSSASQHIETALMIEARRLLAFTQLSVAEIGYRLGFSDPPYFSRRFRRMTGETPSTYRARFSR
ncbi:helix-turn-helix domain-containing protein [Paracoccus binzhouensis]|uniref:helix-turn-helix domain-containing protein n=1 Tax=Paracoccus binzhouensis TaxID=2796149 RepID=UPI001E2A0680|nr:helix-turn-helix domain-containing protein [Paracoccus binzhouensis]